MIARRSFLASAAGTAMALATRPAELAAQAAAPLTDGVPSGTVATARLEALPGKRPLIKLTYRPPNDETPFKGQAWDGGYGIARVGVSLDDGRTWQPATLGEDLGRYSFRAWNHGGEPPP